MAKSGRWQPLAGDRLAKHRVIRTQWFQDKPDQWSSSQSSRFRLRAGTEGSEPRADPACERNPKAGMSKITVFRVKFYDGRTNEFFYSSHVATREGAKIMAAVVIEETATQIDSSQLEPGEQWTPPGFKPHLRGGFQPTVTT